jgi:hypothetical protein
MLGVSTGKPIWRRQLRFIRTAVCAAVAAVIGLAVTSCGTIYYGSHPVPDATARKLRFASAVTFSLPGVDLSLQAQNVAPRALVVLLPIPVSGGNPPYRNLPIWLELSPHDSLVRFDPSRVEIVNAKGDTLRPVAWWGPGVGGFVSDVCLCGEPRAPESVDFSKPYAQRAVRYATLFGPARSEDHARQESRGPIAITRPTCFMILFDGRRAGFDFTLVPGPIDVAGRTVTTRVAFAKGTGFSVASGGL